MISKLRKKIMIVLMSVMCLFLAIIIIAINISTQRFLDSQNRHSPLNPPREENEEHPFQTPVAFVTLSESGEITIESNQIYYLSEEEITSIVRELSAGTEDEGETSEYQLRYIRHPGKKGTVYVFADTQIERAMARSRLINTLIVASIAVVGFLLTSFFLSRWMVKPVQQAWDKQRQFVADASHELKTPLTVILSNTDMLAASGKITDPRNRQRLENISAESQRMRELVESLLALARSDNAPKVPPKEILNLSYQISSAVLTLEPSVYDAGHSLVTEIVSDLYMHANAQEVTQVIEILLDNACKYSIAGSDIFLSLAELSKKEALLQVRSIGEPLTKEECVSIFERFYRTDYSREVHTGYGLGLSIAAEIVNRYGGTIFAESNGVDTNLFKIHFPLCEKSE